VTEFRAARPDEWEQFEHALMDGVTDAFDPEVAAAHHIAFEPERSLIGLDGDRIVATTAALSYDLAVPGATVPCAHVTMVGVNPTHRRRGLLTQMMTRQLTEIHAAGREPIAALWASESVIYPRFGYGLAAMRLDLQIDLHQVHLSVGRRSGAGDKPPPAPGRLETFDAAEARPLMRQVYDSVWANRPGFSGRPEHRWDYVTADPTKRRDGATPLRYTVHFDDTGQPTGYAMWRTKPQWADHGADGTLMVKELVTDGLAGYESLWQFLLTMDLMRHGYYMFAALDEPLVHLVDDPRRMRPSVSDSLWIRVVDVPSALAARRYAQPFEVVLDVTDSIITSNTNRWYLSAKDDRVSCERTNSSADLALDITDLGAVYLGGTSLASLVRAGRMRELRPGAAEATSVGFGWHRLPQAIDIF